MGMGTYIADYYTYSAPVARGLALSMSPFGASSSTGWSRDLDVVGRDRPHAATWFNVTNNSNGSRRSHGSGVLVPGLG